MKKRLAALSMTLLLLFSVLPLSAAAGYLPFADVPEGHYARAAVQYVYDNGLMNGVSSDRFSPESDFTRAMFVTILGRMEGVDPTQYTGSPFSDVSAKTMSWAAPYIQWAAENSIVNGVGNGKFNPNGIITREQYCAIIQRYFVSMDGKISAAPPFFVYLSDGGDISDYAKDAVYALAGYGLIDLAPGYAVVPRHRMTRAEITQTFSRVHALRTTGAVPADLLTRNTPIGVIFGMDAGEVGEYQVLKDREPTFTEFDYWFAITHMGYAAIGFHNGYDGAEYIRTMDTTRSDCYTSRGIGPGSTRAEVQAAYGDFLYDTGLPPYEGDYLWYNEESPMGLGQTLVFWFSGDRVTRILSQNPFNGEEMLIPGSPGST